MATWKELKEQGVSRCCATFKNGEQCRRRAVKNWDGMMYWCAKHEPIMKGFLQMNNICSICGQRVTLREKCPKCNRYL